MIDEFKNATLVDMKPILQQTCIVLDSTCVRSDGMVEANHNNRARRPCPRNTAESRSRK